MPRFRGTAAILAAIVAFLAPVHAELVVKDVPFVQEYHEAYPLASEDENDVNGIAVDASSRVWAATRAGLRYLDSGAWKTPNSAVAGLALDVVCDSGGTTWLASWDGLYSI